MKFIILLLMILSLGKSDNTNFSGLVFYDYTHQLTKNALNTEGFDFKRVYLTYNQNISDNLSYKFQTDIDPDASPKELFLKSAKVDWKSSIGMLTIGLQSMNVFNITNKTWGFRFIEKPPMLLNKFSSPADMGIGYSGKLYGINHSLKITNGAGYKKPEEDKYKKISVQLVSGEMNLNKIDGYNIGGSFTSENYEIGEGQTKKLKNKKLFSLFAGYAGNDLRIGAEYDNYTHPKSDHTDTPNDSLEITSNIISLYLSYKMTDYFEGLIRYDMYDPDTESKNDGNTLLIAGINYYPTKGLIIAPNIRFRTLESNSCLQEEVTSNCVDSNTYISGTEESNTFKEKTQIDIVINFKFKF